jgi:hypothetical protein
MSVDIEGFINHHKRRKITCLQHDDGTPMTHAQAVIELHNRQIEGHKLLPTANCEGFDPFGVGCPGHEVEEE